MADDTPKARLVRMREGLQRLIKEGAAATSADMRFDAVRDWSDEQVQGFWRSRDVAELRGLDDVIDIAVEQRNEADHLRAIAVIEDQLEKLAARFDFRKYEAGGGKRH